MTALPFQSFAIRSSETQSSLLFNTLKSRTKVWKQVPHDFGSRRLQATQGPSQSGTQKGENCSWSTYISVVSKRVVIIRSTRKEWFTVHFCLIYRWERERDFEIKKAISERSVLQECIFRTAGRKKKKAQRGRSSMSMANSYIPLSMTRHLRLFTFEVIIWHLSLTITGKIKLGGIFWKYCIKGLENPISIVSSISIVWKCFRGTEIFWNWNFHTVKEVRFFQCIWQRER